MVPATSAHLPLSTYATHPTSPSQLPHIPIIPGKVIEMILYIIAAAAPWIPHITKVEHARLERSTTLRFRARLVAAARVVRVVGAGAVVIGLAGGVGFVAVSYGGED